MGHKSAVEKDSGQEGGRDGKISGRPSERIKTHLRALKQRPAGNISQRREMGWTAARKISRRRYRKSSVLSLLIDVLPDVCRQNKYRGLVTPPE